MLALSLNGGQVKILSTYVGNARERSRARGDCDGRDWRHSDLAGQGGCDGDVAGRVALTASGCVSELTAAGRARRTSRRGKSRGARTGAGWGAFGLGCGSASSAGPGTRLGGR